ncbi:hypothetical protein JL722_14641 [Aureococcus anophagefferens]|nr:hypothetical protein JL722_14641 [Aureococcus anophagefferens]
MPMKRTKSYVDLYRRTSPAKHVSRFVASLDARLWSYAAGALGLATLTDALRHLARHAVLLLAGAVGTAAYRYGRDGRGGRARLRGSAPPLSALPGDVLSVAVGYLDGCDLLRFFARDLLDRFVAFDPSAVVGVRRHARRGNGDGGAALATMAKFGVVAGRLRRSGAG